MTDLENDEILDAPRVSSAFEFGGTIEKPRTRDKYWYRAFATDSPPDRGLVLYVARRPRTRRGEEPHPTVRIMRPNPVGMLYQKIKSGEIIIETEQEFQRRTSAMLDAGEDLAAAYRRK